MNSRKTDDNSSNSSSTAIIVKKIEVQSGCANDSNNKTKKDASYLLNPNCQANLALVRAYEEFHFQNRLSDEEYLRARKLYVSLLSKSCAKSSTVDSEVDALLAQAKKSMCLKRS